MTRHDERLGLALRELDVPYHGPDFYSHLAERLEQEPSHRPPGRHRPGWFRPPMLLSLGAVAAAVVAVIAMSSMFKGDRPDVLVEVGGGTIPATTELPTLTSRPSSDPTTAPTTGPTTGPMILAAPVPTTTTSRPGMNALTSASTPDLRGLGPVRIGMEPEGATLATGIPFAAGTASAGSTCSYATTAGGPAGVSYVMSMGTIQRIEVRSGSAVKTLSGAGSGDNEADVQARYGGVLDGLAHKYLAGGHYLPLVPTDLADLSYRLIFETDGSKVTNFRAGTLPLVALVEGCG